MVLFLALCALCSLRCTVSGCGHADMVEQHTLAQTRTVTHITGTHARRCDNTVKVWHVPPTGVITLVRVLDCCLPTSLAPLQALPPLPPTAHSEAFVSASLDGVIRRWSDGRGEPDEEVNE
jgi:hypothetical protein